jgi:hypothetical protein
MENKFYSLFSSDSRKEESKLGWKNKLVVTM